MYGVSRTRRGRQGSTEQDPQGARFYGTVPNFGFTSHVRHFNNQDEVRSRYADFFRDLRIDRFLADGKGKAFYLLDGEIR